MLKNEKFSFCFHLLISCAGHFIHHMNKYGIYVEMGTFDIYRIVFSDIEKVIMFT